MLKAHLYKRRNVRNREEVDIALFDAEGAPLDLESGGGVGLVIDGHIAGIHVQGTNWMAYFDGTEEGITLYGIDPDTGQSIELPAGVYTSSWQWGFDISADDGVGDTTRGFSVQLQPGGKTVESYPVKPASGGWAAYNPYVTETIGYDFVLTDPQDLIVMLDATTSDDTDVTFWLNFTVIRLGDVPA